MKKQLIFVFLIMVISASQAVAHREDCDVYDVDVSGFSEVEFFGSRIYGFAQTEIVATVSSPPFYCFDYEFYADIESLLEGPNVYSGQEESGNPDATIVEIDHDDVEAEKGTYCVTSNHQYGGSFIWNDHDGNDVYVILTGDGYNTQSEACLTIEDEPTPTPTPDPTPTPCDPLAAVPCLPTPVVSITPFEVVEKYGTRDVNISVANNASGTTRFTLSTTAGTGTATFENGTNETIVNGDVTNQPLKIKGALESSQLDNIRIEARVNTDSTVLASDNFTVAVITALEFLRVTTTGTSPDIPLDENPGPDGTPNPNLSEGQRVFPDQNNPTGDPDRSIIRVRAVVSPENIPNLKVYFASFDLDDPSANAAPIDPNDTSSGNPGRDNNGVVNSSKSGELLIPAGTTICRALSIANDTSRIECDVTSKGASSHYKVTMQPGDNYAVAASLSDTYRNSISLNSTDGSRLVNTSNQTIAISGESNPDNAAGLRTRMLTTWRRLHIEVDSMGRANANYIRGDVTNGTSIKVGATKTLNVTVNPMEVNRFQNGRMELAAVTSALDVVSNTANSLTVRNFTSNDIVLSNGVNYELLNQTSSTSAIGTVTTGQTITAGQTVTLTVSATAMEVNAFSNGSMFITPTLRSLSVTSNTANSVTVRNNTGGLIQIVNGHHFRLYDDDDMDNTSPTNSGSALNGDENEDVVAPDTSLLTDNSSNPANNVFAPAYIVPRYDLGQSDSDVVFNYSPTWTQIGLFLNSPYFYHLPYETRPDFWTIYLLGAYQPPTYSQSATPFVVDGDPLLYQCGGGLICTTYGAANASSTESSNCQTINRMNDGTGAMVFAEVGRPKEYPADYMSRPISRAHTIVHEVGHLFRGVHCDGDLMSPSLSRTVGTFSDTSLSIIRGTTHP